MSHILIPSFKDWTACVQSRCLMCKTVLRRTQGYSGLNRFSLASLLKVSFGNIMIWTLLIESVLRPSCMWYRRTMTGFCGGLQERGGWQDSFCKLCCIGNCPVYFSPIKLLFLWQRQKFSRWSFPTIEGKSFTELFFVSGQSVVQESWQGEKVTGEFGIR